MKILRLLFRIFPVTFSGGLRIHLIDTERYEQFAK